MTDADAILEAAYVQAAATIVAAKIADAATRKHEQLSADAIADEIESAMSAVKAGVRKRKQAQAKKSAAAKADAG